MIRFDDSCQFGRPDFNSTGRLSDHALLERFQSGDEDAATSLYYRYQNRLRTLASRQCSSYLRARVDADDIVQSVFKSFFRRAKDGRYQVPAGEEIWKLLLIIALNKVRSAGTYHCARKRDVRMTRSERDVGRTAESLQDCDDMVNLQMAIREILENLPDAKREMIGMRIEGHTVQEIADRTSRSKRTVERVIQAFQQELRDSMNQQ